MKKYYFITICAVLLTVYLQGNYINSLYDNYLITEIKMIDELTYQAIDAERHIRSLARDNKIYVPGKALITMTLLDDMTPSERDSILKIAPLPPKPPSSNYNVDELIERGVIRSSGDLYDQRNQDFYFEQGWPLNLRILDSVFVSDLKTVLPHYFIKYDKDKKVVEEFGDTSISGYNYTSKLYQIGMNGSEYVELRADILTSQFIRESVMTLIMSALILLYLLLFMVYQLTVIRKKTEQIEHSQRSINGIIHDLKSPLVSVFAMLNLLHIGEKDSRNKGNLIKNMAGVENMTQNIDSLLSATSMDRRKLHLNKSEIGFETLISAIDIIKNGLSMSYNDKAHIINVENKLPDDTVIYADKMYMENVIRNLLENAVKYSDDGVLITLTLEKEAEMLSVSIKDNGWGIEKKFQKRLFNQFYQVPRRGENSDGYGIGLSHVKHIVTKHGGRVSVKSVKGEGSVFSFLIPLFK